MSILRHKKKIHPGRCAGHAFIYVLLGALTVAALFPVMFMLSHSFMSPQEITASYGAVTSAQNATQVKFHLLPIRATLQGYVEVFLLSPSYLIKFWNSMFLTLCIVAGQVVLSCFSGYGFAKFNYPGKNLFLFLLIILMMLPIQVTLVPNYLVLDKLGLIGKYSSVILPGIFSAFGVFLITQVYSSIPNDILEAVRIDGANHFQALLRIVIPYSRTGIASLVILSFIDNWNMVEQPLVFLKDYRMHPLSIFLS
jgi:multiple sugar transport system permease protein